MQPYLWFWIEIGQVLNKVVLMGASMKLPFISELSNTAQMSTEFFVLLLYCFWWKNITHMKEIDSLATDSVAAAAVWHEHLWFNLIGLWVVLSF